MKTTSRSVLEQPCMNNKKGLNVTGKHEINMLLTCQPVNNPKSPYTKIVPTDFYQIIGIMQGILKANNLHIMTEISKWNVKKLHISKLVCNWFTMNLSPSAYRRREISAWQTSYIPIFRYVTLP